ncbi:hypothetical protein [Segetibacter koreensis]|uniref:AbiTii domain-containing protein n=1 Tax=Segetibacter koreensis TaxID=398037 RepID=UPI0003729C7E|nr:hypothetical protein [Segetibacter koreensis]
MKLISDIVNELVDVYKPLTSPLLKTKVLATRVKNDELLNWVNHELNGYESRSLVPGYRTCSGDVIANFIVGNRKFTNMALPTSSLPKDVEEAFISMNFTENVEALEALREQIKSGKSAKVETAFSAENIAYLQFNLNRNGNPNLQILSAKKWTASNIIIEILAIIRSKLLDFMLKFEEEFGHISEIKELQNENKTITSIMNHTIINTGDANVVNTGDKATVKAAINIIKGSQEDLKRVLKNCGVKEVDINELLEVIDTEIPNPEKGTFGYMVNLWIGKMINKALDGSWEVAIGAAGSLLADAIQSYYGIK